MDEAALKPLAHQAVHTTVAAIFAELSLGSVLDIPAGEGALAQQLLRLGYNVSCCDLYPENVRLSGVEVKAGDLSHDLPYADRSFDYIVCVEGLEHIENSSHAIREFARMIRPGGRLIVSIPNVLNIEERFRLLFSGYTSHFKSISKEYLAGIAQEYREMEEVVLHINPIAYPQLRYSLENNGFSIEKVVPDKPKRRQLLLKPVAALIRLSNRFQSANRRQERWTDELQSDEILLGGNTLIFVAKKADTKGP